MKTLHIGETCTTCGTTVAPIMWGMPTRDGLIEAKRRDWYIGGCFMDDRMSRCECGARSYDGDGRLLAGRVDGRMDDEGGE
jgi:hypothetical protein